MTALNIVVYAVALVLAVAAYLKGGERHILGMTEAIRTLLLVLPTLDRRLLDRRLCSRPRA